MDHAIFSLTPQTKIQCMRVGVEQEPVILIDSFVQGADELRQHAIDNARFEGADTSYPGVRMVVPMIYAAALAKNLQPYIEGFLGYNLKAVTKAASRFSLVTIPPSELSLLQRIPHFDAPTKNGLAAVHYLCDAPSSGTSLYRHRKTGYEFIDSSRYSEYMALVKARYSSPDLYPEGYIFGSTDEFEEIASHKAVFNRLLLYRGSSLHSGQIGADYDFDPSPETGRLTITTFIEFA